MRNKTVFLVILLVIFMNDIYSTEYKKLDVGIKVMAGGRYDDLRMCVGSKAGVKGGPIADIMLLIKKDWKKDQKLALEVPVMRPILFGAAFDMLQFEPQISLEFTKRMNNNWAFMFAPGLGISLHYGPDYKSDLDNRDDSFFAAGPMVSGLLGLRKTDQNDKYGIYGMRLFYIPLFSSETDLSPGTVLGVVFETHFYF